MKRVFSAEQEPAVISAYENGHSLRRIAKERQVSVAAVHGVLKRNGIERRSGAPGAYFDDGGAEALRREYEAGASLSELARRHGCGTTAPVRFALERAGAEMRRRGAQDRKLLDSQMEQVIIDWTSGMSQNAIALKFGVSQTRVNRALTALGLAPERRLQRREKHGRWKGGRIRSSSGYMSVLVEPDDPLASMRTHHGYILEHRLIMARSLGRPLTRSETVHHINGDRLDNRLENLEMRQGKHGNGQRYVCADCGSHNVIPANLTAA